MILSTSSGFSGPFGKSEAGFGIPGGDAFVAVVGVGLNTDRRNTRCVCVKGLPEISVKIA